MSAARPEAETLEDIEFLDGTGVGATDAAKRAGFPTAHAMEKWLERKGQRPLWLRLVKRDAPGTHDSDTLKRRRLMAAPEQIDTIVAVLAQADESSRARTRNRAAKVRELVDDLRSELATEREDHQRRESARKEVERLTKALREAKARMRGTVLDVDLSVSAADLRKWAAANGVECPPMGRVPATVREAYEAADESEAAS